jgi:hypothetical protein
VFGNELIHSGTPPREWAERLYNVRRWTAMPRGGGFAPIEPPDLLARDIASFFGVLTRNGPVEQVRSTGRSRAL